MQKKLKDLFKKLNTMQKKRPRRKKGYRPSESTVIVPDGKVSIKPIQTKPEDEPKKE